MTLSPQKIAAITSAKYKREIKELRELLIKRDQRIAQITGALILTVAYLDSIANRYEGITEFDNAREFADVALKDKTHA